MTEFRFDTEVEFDASPGQVFDAMADIDGFGRWMQGFVAAEKLSEGPYGVGTRWRETRRMFGKEASELFEVRTCERPMELTLYVDGSQGSTGKGEYLFRYRLQPAGSGTRLRCEAQVTMPGLFAKLLGWLFIGSFKKACDRDLYALRDHLGKAMPAEAG